MPEKNKDEILAALAGFVKDSSEPYSILAKRLNVSVSTLRRAAAAYGITRRKRIDESVFERIARALKEGSR